LLGRVCSQSLGIVSSSQVSTADVPRPERSWALREAAAKAAQKEMSTGAGRDPHPHAQPRRVERTPRALPALVRDAFGGVTAPQCSGGEEVVHGRGCAAASQPGSPGAGGQLQPASCLPACPSTPAPRAAPKSRQPGSAGSGTGVRNRMLRVPEQRADPRGEEEQFCLAALPGGEGVKSAV